MNQSPRVHVDITLDNAQQYLIDESFQRPVVVDFWADWCGPCKTLMPLLESLANEYAGAFLLAKINADDPQTQMITAQFGVRSLPTVIVMKDGQPVDGFTGAQSEVQVRELLSKYLPKTWEAPLAEAQQKMAENDFNAALPLLRQAFELSGSLPEIHLQIAQCYLALNRLDNVETILAAIPVEHQDEAFQRLVEELAQKQQASISPEIVALENALSASPDDLSVRYALACQYHQEQQYRPALEHLLAILKRQKDFAEGDARKRFTEILTTLGKGDALAIEFQRKLFTLLY